MWVLIVSNAALTSATMRCRDLTSPIRLFAQDEYRISDALTLSASARLDQHNRYGTFFGPRLAMLWRFPSLR